MKSLTLPEFLAKAGELFTGGDSLATQLAAAQGQLAAAESRAARLQTDLAAARDEFAATAAANQTLTADLAAARAAVADFDARVAAAVESQVKAKLPLAVAAAAAAAGHRPIEGATGTGAANPATDDLIAQWDALKKKPAERAAFEAKHGIDKLMGLAREALKRAQS